MQIYIVPTKALETLTKRHSPKAQTPPFLANKTISGPNLRSDDARNCSILYLTNGQPEKSTMIHLDSSLVPWKRAKSVVKKTLSGLQETSTPLDGFLGGAWGHKRPSRKLSDRLAKLLKSHGVQLTEMRLIERPDNPYETSCIGVFDPKLGRRLYVAVNMTGQKGPHGSLTCESTFPILFKNINFSPAHRIEFTQQPHGPSKILEA
ncbi:MAG: hypothetical protein VKJ06_01360 [Vampirovibrionales bacterium]|nr:hypothetical protein [Vampirovibrionales bacterium]